ncbi:alpha/beta hydrolase-fold protein [Thomasclavelia saccharogumia]|uniref:alpha/beta hydrolase-fold protein n=1 Tax=Thomasclavelia saccharogumia TaxID=341225 RepID=UPI00068A3FB6|nr:alpha/beta hydrolase-fold protein [Thomasclavelia saccharogumia]
MKKNKFKKITAVFLSMLTVCSIISVPAYALSNSTLNTMNDAIEELESIESPKSITITQNTDFPNSDAQYQVKFTFNSEEDISRVQLTGGFAFYTTEAAKEYLDNGSVGTITPVAPENFKNGMFTTGHLIAPGGYVTIDMNEVEKGVWTVEIPLPNGQYYYRFNIFYTGSSRAQQIVDPENKPFANGDNDSGWSLFYVGDATDCLDGQEYVFSRNDDNTGTVNYVSYEAIDATMQPMGVYLPKGYDENKIYKTLYLSHGSGGNEVEWFEIGSAKNIMDNLIAEGEVEDTIIITLDLTYFNLGNSAPGRGFERIKDNIMNYVIPYVESHYSVSKDARDRAFAGLSGGSRLATFLYQENAGDFGYFGMFSHTIANVDVQNIENKNYPTLMLGYGNLDPFGKQYYPNFISRLEAADVQYDLYPVNGGHDWGAWRTLLSIFIKDYLWEDTNKPANPIVDKSGLSIAIEMAEKASLENVVPAVVTEFNEALTNAKEVYSNEKAAQADVDSAFARLANVMQMLEFYQGDKTALQKQVDQINGLDESKYIESSWQAMLPVLDKANAVLADENAMQDEVNEVYTELVKAFLDLRLKPNKDLLNDLINKAQGLNAASYSAESWNVLQETLNGVQAVLDDSEATETEVEAAVTALNNAIEGLVANSEVPVETEVLSADEGVNSAVKAGDTTVSIKTGDSANLGYSLAGLALASMVLVANKKRKY